MHPVHAFSTDWAAAPADPGHRVVVGGVCWDHYLRLPAFAVHRKNLLHGPRLRTTGGGAANVALVQRALDPDVRLSLFALVGDCPEGHALREHLARRRIELPLPPVPAAATSVSFIVTEASGASTILSDPGARALPLPLDRLAEALAGATACCVVSPNVSEQVPAIVRLARARGVPVYFGLGGSQITQLGYDGLADAFAEGVELLICNRDEAARLTGHTEVREQLGALAFGGRVATAVVTDGARGLHALRDGRRYYVPAYTDPPRPVLDDTGAGDAAHGAIVDGLLRGYGLEEALAAGARQGFEACTAVGATTNLLGGDELRAYLAAAALRRAS